MGMTLFFGGGHGHHHHDGSGHSHTNSNAATTAVVDEHGHSHAAATNGTIMIFTKFVEVGRVVYISKGKDEGKLAVITNVVDGNKALIDGPSTGVPRSVRNFKDLQLTKFKVPIRVGQRTGGVKKIFDEAGVISKWNESSWAKGIEKRKLRAGLTDFERHKVRRLKYLRNDIIKREAGKLRKQEKQK